MLQSLHIINFAIIEDTVIDFDQGVTVFTGETGAGKTPYCPLRDALPAGTCAILGPRHSTHRISMSPSPFQPLHAAQRPERVALMMGSEGDGLSRWALAAADTLVTIPMAGGVDSLNVAAASAVAIWALRPVG